MQRQGTVIQGKVVGGIEWLKKVHADGTETQGYTVNPIAGCYHGCGWDSPQSNQQIICYAKRTAEGAASTAYPHGFAHHYWYPARLQEMIRLKVSSRIFVGSMADVCGTWVEDNQIAAILETSRAAWWHDILILTKNAPRLLRLPATVASNVQLGVSSPPDYMAGRNGTFKLTTVQKERYLRRALETLTEVARTYNIITWMSFEPLTADIAAIVADYPQALRWAVIGAASDNTGRFHLPRPEHVTNLLAVLHRHNVPVFFKGNLKGSPAARPWREEYPTVLAKVSHSQASF